MSGSETFYSMGDRLRRMYLESAYNTPEEFLASLEVPDHPEPPMAVGCTKDPECADAGGLCDDVRECGSAYPVEPSVGRSNHE